MCVCAVCPDMQDISIISQLVVVFGPGESEEDGAALQQMAACANNTLTRQIKLKELL